VASVQTSGVPGCLGQCATVTTRFTLGIPHLLTRTVTVVRTADLPEPI
jgi:hypothetical protein